MTIQVIPFEEAAHIPRNFRRPPGTVSEVVLEAQCVGCTDCMMVCPMSLILLDEDGLPLVLSQELCTRCGLCADVCMHDAIQLTLETKGNLAALP